MLKPNMVKSLEIFQTIRIFLKFPNLFFSIEYRKLLSALKFGLYHSPDLSITGSGRSIIPDEPKTPALSEVWLVNKGRT